MHKSVLAALATILSSAVAETLHSVLVYTRHGDRTAKFYKNYQLTKLGATQVYNSGQFYRSRYVEDGAPFQIAGVASDNANFAQLWASAPDQYVLYQTATNFLQGLYPPLTSIQGAVATEEITNGTETEAPLGGYQFVLVHGEDAESPDTIWIKGDEGCPTFTKAANAYFNSTDFKETLAATSDFYEQFVPLLGDIMGPENVTYKNAYNVFDLLNVGSIHNASVASNTNMTPANLNRLHTLANQWEWNRAYNASNPGVYIGGQTLAGGFLNQMSTVIKSKASTKFSLMAGSYDSFLSFFGITDLQADNVNFTGIPDYAASMVFEMYSTADNATFPTSSSINDDLMVRFLFRNGTDDADELLSYPLFGLNETEMTWGRFSSMLNETAITDVGSWCSVCSSTDLFCAAYSEDGNSSSAAGSSSKSSSGSGLSNAAAGGIGAGVTLAVVGILAGLVWLLTKKSKKGKTAGAAAAQTGPEKRVSDSESDRV